MADIPWMCRRSLFTKKICEECSFEANGIKDMMDHIQQAHPATKLYFCTSCNYKTRHRSGLYYHRKENHADLKECSNCKKNFFPENLIRHQNKCGLKFGILYPYTCVQCDEKFTDENLFKEHVRNEGCYVTIACGKCVRKFRTIECLRKHLILDHQEEEESRPFKCSKCLTNFEHVADLRRHDSVVHGDTGIWNCEYCPFATVSLTNLVNHLNRNHRKKASEDARKRGNLVVCETCDCVYTTLTQLHRHLKAKHSKNIYVCAFCKLEDNDISALRRHSMKVHGVKQSFSTRKSALESNSRKLQAIVEAVEKFDSSDNWQGMNGAIRHMVPTTAMGLDNDTLIFQQADTVVLGVDTVSSMEVGGVTYGETHFVEDNAPLDIQDQENVSVEDVAPYDAPALNEVGEENAIILQALQANEDEDLTMMVSYLMNDEEDAHSQPIDVNTFEEEDLTALMTYINQEDIPIEYFEL